MKTRDTILVALFAALTAIGAFIKIPIPYVPFTLQFFFCALSGMLLGAKLGALSQMLYVGLGLTGLPIFASGGGIGYIFNPTFGYLIGFILAAYIIGKISERIKDLTLLKSFIASISGLFVIYLIGVPYLYLIFNFYLDKPKSVHYVVLYGCLSFLGSDLAKACTLSIIAVRIMPILKRTNLVNSFPVKIDN